MRTVPPGGGASTGRRLVSTDFRTARIRRSDSARGFRGRATGTRLIGRNVGLGAGGYEDRGETAPGFTDTRHMRRAEVRGKQQCAALHAMFEHVFAGGFGESRIVVDNVRPVRRMHLQGVMDDIAAEHRALALRIVARLFCRRFEFQQDRPGV